MPPLNAQKYAWLLKPAYLLVFFYSLLLIALALLPFWPSETWTFATLFCFSPLWLLGIPLCLLAVVCWLTRKRSLLGVLLVWIGLYLNINGLVLPSLTGSSDGYAQRGLRILTTNMGGGAEVKQLKGLITEMRPDLVALQEASPTDLPIMAKQLGLQSACLDGLCLLSRFNIKLLDSKSRRLLQNWGLFAIRVEVDFPSPTGSEKFDFYVVHLETPREGFEALMADPLGGWGRMAEVIDGLKAESWIASNWTAQGRNPIVAGDFNLPRNSPIFAQHWGWLTDSFAAAGAGFGYSKHTRVHGIQIDHVLYTQTRQATETQVGHSLGGDHLPVITFLTHL